MILAANIIIALTAVLLFVICISMKVKTLKYIGPNILVVNLLKIVIKMKMKMQPIVNIRLVQRFLHNRLYSYSLVCLFVCLFFWRYNPLWLYFSQPGSGI